MAMDAFDELSLEAERNPGEPWPWIKLARLFLESGGARQAHHLVERARTLAGDDPEVWEAVGQVLEASRDDWAALAAYQQMVVLGRRARGSELTAGIMLRCGKPEHAEDLIMFAMSSSPGSPELYFKLAQARVARGRLAEALEPARRAQIPGDLERAKLLCEVLIALGQHEERATVLADLLEKHEATAEIRMMHADACARLSRMEEARASLDAIHVDMTSDPELAIQGGELYLRIGAAEKAQSLLGIGLRARPDDLALAMLRAGALERCGREEEAIQLLLQLVDWPGRPPRAELELGRLLARRRDLKPAAERLIKAAAESPDDEEVQQLLSEVLTALRREKNLETSGESVITGDLEVLSVAELLEFLTYQRATGVIQVRSSIHGQGSLQLNRGTLVEASAPSIESLASRLDLDFVDRQAPNPVVVQAALRAGLAKDRLARVLQEQIIEGLAKIIGWRDGRVSFVRAEPVDLVDDVWVDPRYALLEVHRAIDEERSPAHPRPSSEALGGGKP